MPIEHARAHARPKPWGIIDLRPWSNANFDGIPIGEIWYERPDRAEIAPSLLLKLLFTNQPLSIQVHPDDAFAHSIGLPNGKTEAWYVLSAAPGAKVALGLDKILTSQQFREAIDIGTISTLVRWQTVFAGDTIFVPAGTIHAIGAGLVIAEIQQRSDATFRIYDYDRQRELHIDRAVAVADAGPADLRVIPRRLADSRTLLIAKEQFVFEKFDLEPNSVWCLEAKRETWLLIISGGARAGQFDLVLGDAIFAQSDKVDIHVGPAGMVGLAACTGGVPIPQLLQLLPQVGTIDRGPSLALQVPTSLPPTEKAAPMYGQTKLSQ